jgi:ubiquinone/menaquinone biosynthesis C-methylase UbiE
MSHGISLEHILDTVFSYQRSAAIKAAIELDLFTAIAEGNTTSEQLARRCGASERGIRILSDYLVILQLVTKTGSIYGLTPDSAFFLDRRSPAYSGSITQFLLSPFQVDPFRDIAAAVKKGGTTADTSAITPEHPMWVDFARAMTPVMIPPAFGIAKLIGANAGEKWKVLDIAAGHGMFGIAIAQRNPNAEIVALDWPNVLQVAEENAIKAGIADRFRKIEGDAMKINFGPGYDVVLITNFLHHFDVATCETFLRKVHGVLKPGGRAVTLEFVPNEDRISPPIPAAFSFMMLGTTPAGDAYTLSQLQEMFRNAGFSRSDGHSLESSPETVIISYA